jgi:hypothetical protein
LRCGMRRQSQAMVQQGLAVLRRVLLGDRPLRYSYEVLIQTGCPGDALETRDPNPFLPMNPPFCFPSSNVSYVYVDAT